jgi:ABC-type lipoprotein release transport system permease subunit
MREFKALLASSKGQTRTRLGQAVKEKKQKDKQSKITYYTEKNFFILSAIAVSAASGFLLIVLIFWLVSAHQRLALSQR